MTQYETTIQNMRFVYEEGADIIDVYLIGGSSDNSTQFKIDKDKMNSEKEFHKECSWWYFDNSSIFSGKNSTY